MVGFFLPTQHHLGDEGCCQAPQNFKPYCLDLASKSREMASRRVSLWLPPKQPFLAAGICSSTYRPSSKGQGGGVCICTPKKRLGGEGAGKHLCCEEPLIFLCLWQLDNRWSKTTMEILSTIGLMLHNLWGLMLACSDLIVWELESSETQSLHMMPKV